MALTFPRRGAYNGRLAFDPDSGFHVDARGRKVVTLDDGKTWRYARSRDKSHNARHLKRAALLDTTANSANPEPHHWEAQPHDDHYDPSAPGRTRIRVIPDHISPTTTSHTEAWQ